MVPVKIPSCLETKLEFIDDFETCKRACQFLRKQCNLTSVSAEGSKTATEGLKMSVLCLGLNDYACFIFDVLSCPDMWLEDGLKGLLEDQNITKVVHGCSPLGFYLHSKHQIALTQVFDIECAHAIIVSQTTGGSPLEVALEPRHVHCNKYIYRPKSLEVLQYLDEMTKNDETFNWMTRPLIDRSKYVAAAKAISFLPDLYASMKALVHVTNQEKVLSMSAIFVTYDIDYEKTQQKLRELFPKNYATTKKEEKTCKQDARDVKNETQKPAKRELPDENKSDDNKKKKKPN